MRFLKDSNYTQREIFKYIALELRTFVLNVLNIKTKWLEEKIYIEFI